MLRVFLFILMQAAVVALVGLVGSVILVALDIDVNAQSYGGLLLFCAVIGCAGSVISLFLSKSMCKTAYRVRVIEIPRTDEERFLVSTIERLSSKAGFNMPEVGIYDAPDPNAFATGASKNSALVAVSSGLLRSMNKDEVRGVLGHEISHIQNGDMVTMSLLQGILNTFVYFFSYIVAAALASRGNRSQSAGSSFFVRSMLQLVFGFVAQIILMWFSRFREYRADAGSAQLNGKENMIKALMALRRGVQPQPRGEHEAMQALCINGANLSSLFATHPSLEDRIEALKKL